MLGHNMKERTISKNRREKIGLFSIILFLMIVAWIILLYYFSPENIVEYIGVKNSYLSAFIGGIIGGTSILLPFPNYLLIFS